MSSEDQRAESVRFHVLRSDGLYEPITFFLVTNRMAQEILEERSRLMASGGANQERQAKLFARYDPQLSSHAFESWLKLFQLPETAGAVAPVNEAGPAETAPLVEPAVPKSRRPRQRKGPAAADPQSTS